MKRIILFFILPLIPGCSERDLAGSEGPCNTVVNLTIDLTDVQGNEAQVLVSGCQEQGSFGDTIMSAPWRVEGVASGAVVAPTAVGAYPLENQHPGFVLFTDDVPEPFSFVEWGDLGQYGAVVVEAVDDDGLSYGNIDGTMDANADVSENILHAHFYGDWTITR